MPLMRYERGFFKFPRRIFLALPVGDGKPFDNHVVALPNTALALAKHKIGMDFAIEGGNVHVDDARNALVRQFLQTDCTDLVFIDADVGWRPEDLVRLVQHDRDIVAGIYPKKQDEIDYPVYWKDPRHIQADPDGCIEVARVPTGFLRIKRHVVEKLVETVPHFRGNGDKEGEPLYPIIFERTLHSGKRWSGDYEFSNKATTAGFKIHIDPDMTLTHTGLKTWEGNLAGFLRRRNDIANPHFMVAIGKVLAGSATSHDWWALFREWDNPYAAPPELLFTMYQAAASAKGPVLETGSGLTTILMGLASQHRGGKQRVVALEHDVDWLRKTRKGLERYKVETVDLIYTPLKEYGPDKWWYDITRIPKYDYDLVLCDGPQRRFGRWGLFKLLGEQISGANWMMDDADDPSQIAFLTEHAGNREITVHMSNVIPGRGFAIAPREGPK